MLFTRALPPGPPAEARDVYTGLRLAELAPPDRPYVVCNFVSSADGRATIAGRSGRLGGAGDRAAFHLLRTQPDAIMAGTATMRTERYGRLVREREMEELRVAEGRAAQPLAVLVSRSGAVPFDIPLFADEAARIALYVPPSLEIPVCPAEIERHEVEDLPGVMRSLRAEHAVRSLLCEGGPALFNALLAAGLVDELFLTLAPSLAGAGEMAITSGSAIGEPVDMELVWAVECAGSLLLRYRRR